MKPGRSQQRGVLLFVGLMLAVLPWMVLPSCSPGPGNGNEASQEPAANEPNGNKEATGQAEPSKEPVETTEPSSDASVQEQANQEETPEAVPEAPSEGKAVATPEPYPFGAWRVTTLAQGTRATDDKVLEALDNNTFQHSGSRVYLTYQWEVRTAKENGEFGSIPNGRTTYAATFATMKEETRAIAQADRVTTVYINGKRFSGDVYGSGKYRIPILLKKGRNDIVISAGSRGTPKFNLWLTPDEVYFNPSDRTMPTLMVGDQTEQCLGMPILNLLEAPIEDLKAEVLDSTHFEATSVTYPGLPSSSTQVRFHLKPKKAFEKEEEEIEVRLRLSSPNLQHAYIFSFKEKTTLGGIAHRRTRISEMDGSCQFDGVLPPKDFDPQKKYGLILSLHGAGVNALGQVRSYSQKDWAYVVAPTNRRPFGFDWELYGRLDGLEALAFAKKTYNIDPTKVYVTGHSMGGHGTWQFGVLFPGYFALVGPSAGWSSFYSYTGYPKPTSIFARSQASSETNNYLSNIAKRAVYIIHGDKDDNVPVREGRTMFELSKKVTNDAHYHEEPDVKHWWNKKDTPGTDCVDWGPMMEMVQKRSLDPYDLDFKFRTPGAFVSPKHSYVMMLHAASPMEDSTFESKSSGDTVTLTTTNVGAMTLDGKALQDKGVKTIKVDGKDYTVDGKPIPIGPQDGKRPGVHGPFWKALAQPYCYIYPDQDNEAYTQYANYMVSNWNFIGNGHVGCMLPLSKVTDELRSKYNMIYLGIPLSQLKAKVSGFDWTGQEVKVDGKSYNNVAMAVTFPENGRLSAALFATKGREYLLYRIPVYTSRFAIPDFFVWTDRGYVTAGFFDAKWQFEAKYKVPN
ncbi:MAG: hypothetical protein EP343_08680 [Deltaproteobacteria bacterium]|nr:MAG: hypothetical protein EP343_08680 [Deltaproteobacteria bacterium]